MFIKKNTPLNLCAVWKSKPGTNTVLDVTIFSKIFSRETPQPPPTGGNTPPVPSSLGPTGLETPPPGWVLDPPLVLKFPQTINLKIMPVKKKNKHFEKKYYFGKVWLALIFTVAQRGHKKYFSTACARSSPLRAHAVAIACSRSRYCVRTQWPIACARSSYCVRTQ